MIIVATHSYRPMNQQNWPQHPWHSMDSAATVERLSSNRQTGLSSDTAAQARHRVRTKGVGADGAALYVAAFSAPVSQPVCAFAPREPTAVTRFEVAQSGEAPSR